VRRSNIIKLVLLVLVVSSLIWFNQFYLQLTPVDIKQWILAFGWIAPLIYVLLYTLRALIFFPVTIMALTGGLAFGVLEGSLLTLLGALGGAMLAFLIARYFRRGLRLKTKRGQFEKLEEQLASRGFVYVLFVRLLPFVPFDLVSYAAGATRMRKRDFFFATLFGAIPLTVIYSFIGARLAAGSYLAGAVAFAILLALTGLLLLYRKKMGWYA
jgi:uncharacterized membrane protein YdjX (TVP38/TMEM64 family)